MHKRSLRQLALAGLLLAATLLSMPATASGRCPDTVPSRTAQLPERIAAIACRENRLWYQPFIDLDGRLASMTVAEAETAHLSDGVTPAWKRVVDYWRGSGQLWGMRSFPGATTCAHVDNHSYPPPGCRAFLVDRPWSAVFVSYVMVQAGVPGFHASPSHIDYVRDAYLHPQRSPYRLLDPASTSPALGDLLCFVRTPVAVVAGYHGLTAWLRAKPDASLPMHCEIVVAAEAGGELLLVGGNVLQGVTLRMLALNRQGRLWGLPHGDDAGCSPAAPDACNFNRQNWAALLKLKPGLRPAAARPSPAAKPVECCVYCKLGSGVPRCKKGGD